MFARSITFLPAYFLLVHKLTAGKTSERFGGVWGGLFLYRFLLFSSLNITNGEGWKELKLTWEGGAGLKKLLWSTIPVIIFLPQTVKKQEILIKHLHISTSCDGYIHIFSQPPTVIMTEYTLTALLFDILIVLVHCFLSWVSANTRRRGLGLFCSCGSLEYQDTWGRTREADGKT